MISDSTSRAKRRGPRFVYVLAPMLLLPSIAANAVILIEQTCTVGSAPPPGTPCGEMGCAVQARVCTERMVTFFEGGPTGVSASPFFREPLIREGRQQNEKTVGGETNAQVGPKNCDDITTKPVVVATGNKVLSELDFAVTSTGVSPLSLTRSYDKQNSIKGMFGANWVSNIEQSLSFEFNGTQCRSPLSGLPSCSTSGQTITKVLAIRSNGYAAGLVPFSTDIWKDSEGNQVQRVGSEWRLTTRQGGTEVYDTYGRPLTIKDSRSVGLTYSYNGSNQLATITHTSGRSIGLTWTGNKVTTITAPNSKAYTYGYNAGGYLTSVVYPDSLGTRTYHYENAAQPNGLTGISINGVRYSRYAYLTDGKAAWSGLEGGIEKSTFTYGTDYTDVKNALNQTSRYYVADVNSNRRVIAVSRPISATCPGGVRESFFDANGNVSSEQDAFDVKTKYTYDSDNRLTQKITGVGSSDETDQQQITQYVWDATYKERLNQVKIFGTSTGQPLSTTTYAYYPDGDAKARLLQSVAVTNQAGGTVGTLTTTYTYTLHSNGLVATMIVDGPLSGAGDAITTTFDTAGNVLTVKNSLNHTITYANYNALGQPGMVTSPNGAVTEYTYNARGQMLTEKRTVNGLAQTTSTTYDTRGRPISVTTPDAETVNTEYDAYDRVTGTFKSYPTEDGDPATYNESVTETQATNYNLLSQPLSVTTTYRYAGKEWDPDLGKPINIGYVNTQHRVSFEYDEGGFLSKRKGENNQVLTYTYNDNGDLYQVKNALTHTTTYAYDRHRRVSSITDAGGGVTLMGYSPLGQTTLVRDARLNSTAYVYDGLGNLLSQTSPDTGMTTFTYNSLGQRTQVQRADLSITTYSYDTLGRLGTTVSGGQSRTLSYDSCTNGKGMLCSAAKAGGTATTANFTYTPWGQLATRQDVLSGNTDITAFSYDGMHRLTGISYPSGVSAGYGYVGGHLTSITATVNGTTTTVAQPSGYQAFGPPIYMAYGNGLWKQTNYDADRRITGISVSGNPAGLTQSLTYAFDYADRITDITNGVDAANSWDFTYDNMSRVTGAQNPGNPVGGFGYDAIGNRISRSTGGVQNTTLNYPTSSSRLQSYVTSTLTRNYGYNSNGDTTLMTGTDGVANTFAYDPFGRLASHTRSGVTTSYTVNALDQRMSKSNSSSNSRYVYAGFNQLLAESTNGAWTSYIWNGSEPIALVRSNQIYYIHTDHLGRPESVTNANKALVWKANNNAFSRGVTLDTIGGLQLGFPGQYWDTESSVWHNGFRDYEQTGGRYLQSDPIGLGGGINTYAYTSGDPVNRIDPLGLLWYGGHFSITYRAARSTGFGFRDSLRLAWQVMSVDWRQGSQGTTPDATKLHAMAAPGQPCPDAQKAADDLIAGKDPDYANDLAARIHAAQDASAPWHYGQTWDGNITASHVWSDVFYGDEVGDAAYEATRGILGGGP